MDDLKGKLRDLFQGKGLPSAQGKFKGHAHKLGSASGAAVGSHPSQRSNPQAPAAATRPSEPQTRPQQPKATAQVAPVAEASSQGYQPPPPLGENGELALSILLSAENGHLAAGTLRKVLGNLQSNPNNPKFQRLRMLNPKVQETVTGVPGGLELLVAAGFDVKFEVGDGGEEEGWAVWTPGEETTSQLQSCLLALNMAYPEEQTQPRDGPPPPAAPPPPGVSPSNTAVPVVPHPRNTRVQLPVAQGSSGTQAVIGKEDDELFVRSTRELAAEAKARAAKREQESMLSTKAWKESQKVRKVVHKSALLRVRMPDGIILEGEFGVREPTSSIYQWVSECLRHSWAQFDLFLIHQKLAREGPKATVGGQELCPSAMLNFRWADKDPQLTQGTSLSDDTLKLAA